MGEMGRWGPKGANSQLCKMNASSRSTVQHRNYIKNVVLHAWNLLRENEENLRVMNMSVAIMVIVSWVYAYPQGHWIVYIKYLHSFICQTYKVISWKFVHKKIELVKPIYMELYVYTYIYYIIKRNVIGK